MKTKEVRGITIISLVVTIVVLLILAGVSVSLVIGNNNLFDKAKSTQKVQTIAGIKEALELEKADIQVESKRVNLENYLEQISTGKKNYDLSSTEKIDNKNAYIIINDQYKFLLKDKENGDVEIIYEGVAVSGDLTLSSYDGTYTYPNSGTFTVTNNVSGGELSVESDASNIVTASIKENTITVVPGTTAGKANIIVKSAANGDYAENKVIHVATVENGTIKLSVTPYTGIYDGQEHNALSNISVEPSDTKLEYSINGGKYSEEMPKIKDTSSFTVTVVASKEGYKTVSTTETIKVNRAEGKLTLSSYSGTLTYPNSTSFTINENTTNVNITSSNTNIATASLNGNTVTVKPGTTAGKAIITVTIEETINYTSKTATYEATVNNGSIDLRVTPYTGTYDGRQHNAVTVNVTPSDAKLEYSINGGTYSTTMPTVTNTSSFTVTVQASKAGYKTQSTTQTTKVNKANGSLSLSSYSGTINYPNSTSFTTSGTGSISAWSSNTGVATVSVSGNTVTVKSIGAGSATITVKSASNTNYNEKTVAYAVTVKIPTFTESSGVGYYADVDGNGTVDGIIYADRKIGASGNWGLLGGSYAINTVSNTKNYYVSQKKYSGKFGTKDVLAPTGSGNARFYVIALNDYNNGTKYSYSDAKDIKSGEWKVPTANEWRTCAAQLEINAYSYSEFGLQSSYWTTDVYDYIGFNPDKIYDNGLFTSNPVRLTRTF